MHLKNSRLHPYESLKNLIRKFTIIPLRVLAEIHLKIQDYTPTSPCKNSIKIFTNIPLRILEKIHVYTLTSP